MEGMQPESRRNRRLSVGFGIAGHAMSFLSAAHGGTRDEFLSAGAGMDDGRWMMEDGRWKNKIFAQELVVWLEYVE